MITAVCLSMIVGISLFAVVLSLGTLCDIDVFPLDVGLFVLFCLVIPLVIGLVNVIVTANAPS